MKYFVAFFMLSYLMIFALSSDYADDQSKVNSSLETNCKRFVKKHDESLHFRYGSTQIKNVSRVDKNTFKVEGVTWIKTSPTETSGYDFERCYSFIGSGDSMSDWFFDRPATEKLVGYN